MCSTLRNGLIAKKFIRYDVLGRRINEWDISLNKTVEQRHIRKVFKKLAEKYPSGGNHNIHAFVINHCRIDF